MNGQDIIKELMDRLQNHETRITALEGVKTTKTGTDKRLSIKEFILHKKPKDDVQKTLVIGYYLERDEGMDSFNARDITERFRLAKEPPPANVNDKINLNIAKGYMMPTKEKKDKFKAWTLTNSGEKFVEEGLPESDK